MLTKYRILINEGYIETIFLEEAISSGNKYLIIEEEITEPIIEE